MIVATILVAAGLFLSAFFSGSETGFYRVTRVRLVMDAKSGKWIARSLLWLIRIRLIAGCEENTQQQKEKPEQNQNKLQWKKRK